MFSGDDKAQLALAAGVVGASLKEHFSGTVQEVMKLTLKAAASSEDTDGFNDKFMELFRQSGEVDEFVTALQFLGRFVNDVAASAADELLRDNKNLADRFGRN